MEVSRKRAESPSSPKLGGKFPKLDTNMATENIKNTLVDVGQQFDRWCELMVIIGAITHEAFALDLLNWFERCPKLSAAKRKKGIIPAKKVEESDDTHSSGDGISCDKPDNQSAASQNCNQPEQRSDESYKLTLNDSCPSSPVQSQCSPSMQHDAIVTEKDKNQSKEADESRSEETEKSETDTCQGVFPVMVMAVPGADEAITADPSTTVQYTNQSTPDDSHTESIKPTIDNPMMIERSNQSENKVFGPRHVIEAVKMVCSGNMSIEDASVAYKVPRRTLEKKVIRYKAFQACISTSDENVDNDGKPLITVDTSDNEKAYVMENNQMSVNFGENDGPSATSRSSSPQDVSKGYYRSYNSDILPSVAMSVAEGQIRLMEACKQFNIPKSTLQARIKQYKLKRGSADEYSTAENDDNKPDDSWSSQQICPSGGDVINPSSMIASCNADQLRQVIQALDEENEEISDAKLSRSEASENPTIQALLEGASPNDNKSHSYYKMYDTTIVPSLVENVVKGKMTYNEVVNDFGIPRRALRAKVKVMKVQREQKEQKLKEHVENKMKKDACEDPNVISNNSSIQILNVQSGTDPIVIESDEMVLQKEYTDMQDRSGTELCQSDVENDSSSATSDFGNVCVDMADLRKQHELMKIPGLTGTEPIKKVMKLVEQGKVTMQQAARHFSIPRFILPKPNGDGSPVVLDVSSPADEKPKNKFISSLLAKKIKTEVYANSSSKWSVQKRPVCRGSYKTYDTKLLPQILDLVIQGHLTQLEAHKHFNIPKSTLQFKLKQMKSRMKAATGDSENKDDSSSQEGPIATVTSDSSMVEDQMNLKHSEENTKELDGTEENMRGNAELGSEDQNPPSATTCKVEYVWDGKSQEEEEEEDVDIQDVEFETLKDSLDDDPNLLHIDSDDTGPSIGETSPSASRTYRGNYKHYNAEILLEILQNVDQRKITQQQACNRYGIPKSTLQCKLKAYRETGSLQVSPRSRYAPQKRGHYKTYDSSQLPKIAKLVKNGKLKLKQACNLYNIPMSTLQQKIKKIEPDMTENEPSSE